MAEQQRTTPLLIPFAKMASVIAFLGGGLAAFNHLAGYSYLKGRIFGMGLGLREIVLSQQEITFQTIQFLSELHKDALHDTSLLLGMGWIPTLIFILIGGLFLRLIFPKSSRNKVSDTHKNFFIDQIEIWSPQWLKNLFGYCSMFALGFYGFLFLFLTLLSYLAGGLSVAYEYGKLKGQQDISSKVCIDPKDVEDKKGRKAGCSAIYTIKGDPISGRIIHHNENMTVMLTNTESFILDSKGNFTACSPIFDLALDMDKQPKNNCPSPKL